MSKRKGSTRGLAPEAKKLKTVAALPVPVTNGRTTRSSRTRAPAPIKQQVDISSESSNDSSSDDFIMPSKSDDTTGVVVTAVNSFLSDCSSSSEGEDNISPSTKKKQVKKKSTTTQVDSDSESSATSSVYFEKPSTSCSSAVASNSKINDFDAIEKNILTGVMRLSDSEESDIGMEDVKPSVETFIPNHILFPSLVKNHEVDENDDVGAKTSSSKRPHKDKNKASKSSEVKLEKCNNVLALDVTQLLALGETQVPVNGIPKSPKKKEKYDSHSKHSKSRKSIKQELTTVLEKNKKILPVKLSKSKSSKCEPPSKKSSARDIKSESEEGSDWEEVEHETEQQREHVIPKDGVEVTVQLPDIVRRRKKKGFDMEAHIKRRINQSIRDNQVVLHKVSLLCWLGHGMYVNKILNSPSLMGFALSLIPSQHCYPPRQVDLGYLEKITKWFKKNVALLNEPDPSDKTLENILEECFQSKKAFNKRILVLLFVCMMRSLGVKTRLILSLQPLPLKPSSDDLCTITAKNDAKPSTSKKEDKSSVVSKDASTSQKSAFKSAPSTAKHISSPKIENTMQKKSKGGTSKSPQKASTDNKSESSNLPKKSPEKSSENRASEKLADKPTKRRAAAKKDSKKREPVKRHIQKVMATRKEVAARVLRGLKPSTYKDPSSDEENIEEEKETKKVPSSKTKKSKSPRSKSPPRPIKSEADDSDFEPEVVSVRKSLQRQAVDRRVLSSEEEVNEVKVIKTKSGVDVWAEVFAEMEEKWICVDVAKQKVHCVSDLKLQATPPVLYVMAFGMDSSLRDVTRRYCPQFHSTTRKQRVDAEWWDSAIEPFYGRRTAHDREEEEDLDKQLQDRPLPTSIGEYKNHPLYAINRHLLKFEAIYPPESAPLGYIRGETVYSRDCVFTLRSRETWIKEAKIVMPKQEPYKIVKARPKYDRMSGEMMKAKPLEIFGPWQVEDYVPPPAVDGKVPRNEYGNVELFKPTMLPKGTVHLKIPSLNRTAKKLQIDCAPAMVGFDYHCGGCHPLFDGFVVCEEFMDALLDAHRQEEEEREKRQDEKRLKRVYGNWRRLINGLLIREKLKRKYSFGSPAQAAGTSYIPSISAAPNPGSMSHQEDSPCPSNALDASDTPATSNTSNASKTTGANKAPGKKETAKANPSSKLSRKRTSHKAKSSDSASD